MTDPDVETVRVYLDDYVSVDEGHIDATKALDRLAHRLREAERELREWQYKFESYVAAGPMADEGRAMLIEEHNRAQRYEAALRQAPHGIDCEAGNATLVEPGPCTCYRAALTDPTTEEER